MGLQACDDAIAAVAEAGSVLFEGKGVDAGLRAAGQCVCIKSNLEYSS